MDAEMVQLPRYKCHKEVCALQIKEIDGDVLAFVQGDVYAPRTMPDGWVEKRGANPGGYLVVYKDGYESWSPKEAFEEGYTLVE